MSCIFSTIASLEATINGFLINIETNNEDVYKTYKNLFNIWYIIRDRKKISDILHHDKDNILKKYNIILKYLNKKITDKIWQRVDFLIELRNAYTHYKMYVGEKAIVQSNELYKKYTGKDDDLKLNPFYTGNLFFPTKCLSYELIEWGFQNTENFIEEFYNIVALPGQIKLRKSIYDNI